MRLILDWDGTVTERDTLHMVVERFGDPAVFAAAEAELGRSRTLNDVIAAEMRTVRAPLEDVVEWLLATVRVRRGFAAVVAAHRPLVVSAGFHELIRPVLRREGVDVPVVANTVDPRPDGWVATFRARSICAVCGEPCKRCDVAGLGSFAYAGDGWSDRCVACAATRVFARDGLARYLDGQGVPFEPFGDLDDLARRLGSE